MAENQLSYLGVKLLTPPEHSLLQTDWKLFLLQALGALALLEIPALRAIEGRAEVVEQGPVLVLQ